MTLENQNAEHKEQDWSNLECRLEATHLIQSVHFHDEAIHARHAADWLKIWQLRGKAGIERDIVEILVSRIWLIPVLQVEESRTG